MSVSRRRRGRGGIAYAAGLAILSSVTIGVAPAAHGTVLPALHLNKTAKTSSYTCGYYSGHALTVRGNTGARVREVQCLLGLPIDGVFGSDTEKTVKQFQAWYGNGLVVDGKVGSHTWEALREVAGGIHG
ncbi:peptidoglycan-binding protein [Streptomyces sioyaensis]|uniref:peptidoglycan-binding domain-containing protein n=1 Tax=Streptomyces sioyaensis TaxID=67364 RepID=UPI00371C735C